MSHSNSGFLFVSARCPHSAELLNKHEYFRSDLNLSVIKVDENNKKTKALIDAFDITGVPTLVINNEKHSEGQDVFRTLLPKKDAHDRPSAQPDRPRIVGVIASSDQMSEGTSNLDFEPAITTRESNDTQGLDARLKQLEAMRKQADDQSKRANESFASQKMLSSRQCDPIDDDGVADFSFR